MKQKSKKESDALLSQLRQALTDKTEIAVAARIELRDAVCRYVAAEERKGTSLLLIIETVKGILSRAEKRSTDATDELAQQLIDWCQQFHGTYPGLQVKPC